MDYLKGQLGERCNVEKLTLLCLRSVMEADAAFILGAAGMANPTNLPNAVSGMNNSSSLANLSLVRPVFCAIIYCL
jgi:hypothetical protein